MPKAYLLLQFTVNDPEKFGLYRQAAAPLMMAHGGKALVAAGNPDIREGAFSAKLVTIIEFPSKADAEAWYTSPEYAAVKHLRHEAAATESLVFLDGFTPPA